MAPGQAKAAAGALLSRVRVPSGRRHAADRGSPVSRWPDPLSPDRHLEPDPVGPRIAMMLALVAILLGAALVGLDAVAR